MSLLGLVARFSRSALCTLQLRVFFHYSRSLKKRASDVEAESFGLPPQASKFTLKHMDLLKLSFKASAEKDVIPEVKTTNIPDQYVVPHVTSEVLCNPKFDVLKFGCISDPEVQTFITKLHEVMMNRTKKMDRDETLTDTLVDDLLRVVKLNAFPLMIRNKPEYEVYVMNNALVTAKPEFIIRFRDNAIVAVEDKHLDIIRPGSGFGEAQLAIEMLASGSENMRPFFRTKEYYRDQTIFAARVISTYVTFYKAVIPAEYWKELDQSLPKDHSVEIQRWPAENILGGGLDLAEPDARKTVLTSLIKIRQFILLKKPVPNKLV